MQLIIRYHLILTFFLSILLAPAAHAASINVVDSSAKHTVVITKDPPLAKPSNKLSLWSLILSGAGFLFTFIPGIAFLSPFLLVGGVVTGIISLGQIKKRKEKGSGLAVAGIIVGGVSILAAIIVVAVILSIFN